MTYLLKEHTLAAFLEEADLFFYGIAANLVIIRQTVDAHILGGATVDKLEVNSYLVLLKLLAALEAICHYFLTSLAL